MNRRLRPVKGQMEPTVSRVKRLWIVGQGEKTALQGHTFLFFPQQAHFTHWWTWSFSTLCQDHWHSFSCCVCLCGAFHLWVKVGNTTPRCHVDSEGSGGEVKGEKPLQPPVSRAKKLHTKCSSFTSLQVLLSFSSHQPQDTVCVLPGISAEILGADTGYQGT